MTSQDNLLVKAVHTRATWGSRCDTLLFASEQYDPAFPTINISVQSGTEHLVDKTLATFKYIFKHHLHDADWFLKADDDTYVIVENLRHFLSDKNPEKPAMFGNHFMTGGKFGFMSGGAGYVISKEALARFGHQQESPMCRNVDSFAEDIFWTECMVSLGVNLGDSTDHLGRTRFHCQDVSTIIHGTGPEWTLKYGSKGNISDSAISFHYINPQMMHVMDFMVYHLNPLSRF
ncbi:hypothetical protein CAPTEDRAFT_174456 [Capitella teleta]|uniref:N-acetylgalactosaminide beta-1,3-galactosyltransferase n=1 Tax=Capitella teleta TaxID=283909 RepID=R7V9G9_CAPTE|nr:hypothetical protein CAPTEDRAFT_174456 [Capitella teleta]|eukprot:ELU13006.1 hypothetical protein CAPTEDRAFT_174456 [Capitella teleta]